MTIHDSLDFVSVAEASRLLGISRSTVKRRIAAGTLDAEQLQRAQGVEYRVRIRRDVPAPSIEPSDSETTAPPNRTTQDISAAITAAVVPLLERLAVADAAHERQAAALRELEREVGRLTAQLAASTGRPHESSTDAPTGPAPGETATDSPGGPPGVWERLWPVLAVGAALVLAALWLFLPR